ncbi:hypothetical protein Afil01_53950 [Actinorhabdospora filicis]|uniref:TerD domain-containing protein n=1 Tax=Actinorhabdospora filicis TaxID=1785913 RepID=A0A9W6WBZ9_9ACTN|nr:TerD family protein [Actinorhabdospora filicis]GLZ80588.1 hypothetical protein Afil01_53950 [Actinorhabdospora filicis]
MESLVIHRTLRVPRPEGEPGEGVVAAARLDAVLLRSGFTMSGDLLRHLAGLRPRDVDALGTRLLPVVAALIGAEHAHNPYFPRFPADVPETIEFWVDCLRDALKYPVQRELIVSRLLDEGRVNLLDLPKYGTYQHTYEEMLEAHDEFTATGKERLTVLHLGASLDEELSTLYGQLAGSAVPLGPEDWDTLAALAAVRLDTEVDVPVRESRAAVNLARLRAGRAPMADSIVDVLRLANAAGGGRGDLTRPVRFRFGRPERRVLLTALHEIVRANPAHLADVARHREQWKRLGEKLHPHEHPRLTGAAEVFAVARGDARVSTLAGRVELALGAGDVPGAVKLLKASPGMLLRSADRLARLGSADLAAAIAEVAPRVSGRVLLSLREHLANRDAPEALRIFVNRAGKAWVSPDAREPLDPALAGEIGAVLEAEIASRLPAASSVTVAADATGLTIPLSLRDVVPGFGVLPRGSETAVEGPVLRLFTHWRQTMHNTDFDLSVEMLDEDFGQAGQVSYTSLQDVGGVHSGDLTSAPQGATEFIDITLDQLVAPYLLPEVHIYSGEGFGEVATSYFGYMERSPEQAGLPFEPSTVRVRSDLRDSGRTALPLVVYKGENGWTARWINLFLRGHASLNSVETAYLTTSALVRGAMARRYLRVGWLARLWPVTEGAPAVHIGLTRPEGLPEETVVYTPDRLGELVPE